MFHRIFRSESYCLGISVLIVFMLYYIIICNKRINSSEDYNGERLVHHYYKSKVPVIPKHVKYSTDEKNSLPYSIFDAFSAVIHNKQFSEHIIVHIDLKGAPPRISYLKNFMILIKSLGATGILVEYEDMFPYNGQLKGLSALNAYSIEEIRELYTTATIMGLEFIPLVQTFGHLEFLLKLKEYSELREVPTYPQAICPTNNNTMTVLKLMLDQVINLHPGIKWLHIGSDEVYYLGECKRCQQVIIDKYWSKDDLFLSHATLVAKYVNTFHIIPIMWDDEFRKIPIDILKASDIVKIVEIMVWHYSPGIIENISTNIWDKYTQFRGVWMASAFKGAADPNSFITDIGKRLNNNKEWMEVYQMMYSSIKFKGIALTGWQRFDHFGSLCELLPEAVPSLALSMAYIKTNKADHATILRVGSSLGCDSFLNTDLEYMEYINDCNYPGSSVLKIMQRLYMLKKDVKTMLDSNSYKGWLSQFNIKHKFSSPHSVEMALQDLSLLLFECKKLVTEAMEAMTEVYDEYTVNEWISLNLYPLQQELNTLHEDKILLLSKTTWKRNPQNLNKTIEEYHPLPK